jgi:hypothetical protein
VLDTALSNFVPETAKKVFMNAAADFGGDWLLNGPN